MVSFVVAKNSIGNVFKKTDKTTTNNITDINGERTNDITKIYQESSDDDFRQSLLNVVVANAEASKMGVNND